MRFDLTAINDCVFASISKHEFETAFREEEHTYIEKLEDFVTELNTFKNWAKKKIKRMFSIFTFMKVC